MRYKNVAPTKETLNEIKMSTGNLVSLTKNIDASVGIEYEFVYTTDMDDPYTEAPNKKFISVNDAVRFFGDSDIEPDDYDIYDTLETFLKTEYDEWKSEKENNADSDRILEYIKKSYYDRVEGAITEKLKDAMDEMGLDEDKKRDIMYIHLQKPHGFLRGYYNLPDNVIKTFMKKHISDSNDLELIELYLKLRKPVYENIDKMAKDDLVKKNDTYRGIIRKIFSERKFMEENYPDANALYNFAKNDSELSELPWPMKEPDPDNALTIVQREIDDMTTGGSLFGDYTVETDQSIQADESYGEAGIELKNSQPISLEEALNDLKVISDYIEGNGYTNDSTGLHINVSVPNFSVGNMDYVKLILLLGDQYLLKEFDREYNTYAESAIDKLKSDISDQDKINVLEELRDTMGHLAGQLLHDGWTEKYTSVNVHNNRVEFRGPGGSWLEDKTQQYMENMIRRMVVALDASLDQSKYQREYTKKLYKLLNPYTETQKYEDPMFIFSLMSSGMMPKSVAKNYITKIRSNRKVRDIHYMVGAKDGSYVWGSGKTKQQAVDDAKRESENNGYSWNEEIKNTRLYPTNRETHELIQSGGHTFAFSYDESEGIYVPDQKVNTMLNQLIG